MYQVLSITCSYQTHKKFQLHHRNMTKAWGQMYTCGDYSVNEHSKFIRTSDIRVLPKFFSTQQKILIHCIILYSRSFPSLIRKQTTAIKTNLAVIHQHLQTLWLWEEDCWNQLTSLRSRKGWFRFKQNNYAGLFVRLCYVEFKKT